ncbi:MAG: ATP-grasp domain-containing protein [Deltaproteobacteria bacterium]|nr:ATP-grasp domain-containing protein [Deltaproteobacteria bacterium]
MNNKPIAIVLGGTVPHIALIKNLQQRGYHTILIDYFKNPPAKEAADEHMQETTLDLEKVLDIARKRKVNLVISTCLDQANVTACYVSEKLDLPAPYSYETALNVTNKVLMKRKMIDNNIPTSKYCHVHNVRDFDKYQLKFPVVVKPADSNGSKGVRRANNYGELHKFLEIALTLSRCDEAVIEEYKEGLEIGIDCFVKNNEATILMTKERRKIFTSPDPIQQIYGCVWPANITKKIHHDIKCVADAIAQAFNLENTPLMMQAIVNNDEINVLEFAARFGGGESYKIIKLSTTFDIIDAAVDSFLGIQVSLDYKLPESYYADNFIYARPGLFGEIAGYEEPLKNGLIEYLNYYKTKGMEIGADMSGTNRVGVFAVKSDSRGNLFEKINATLEKIEVYDIYGKPIMRKDIYCS